MTVVIDTNVLLVAVARSSSLHTIFRKLVAQQFDLAISTEIFLEYEEIFQRKFGEGATNEILNLLRNLPNVQRTETYYYWQIIAQDPDDNKFIDCAVAANATYIISNDAHFRILKRTKFPPLKLLTGEEFVKLLED